MYSPTGMLSTLIRDSAAGRPWFCLNLLSFFLKSLVCFADGKEAGLWLGVVNIGLWIWCWMSAGRVGGFPHISRLGGLPTVGLRLTGPWPTPLPTGLPTGYPHHFTHSVIPIPLCSSRLRSHGGIAYTAHKHYHYYCVKENLLKSSLIKGWLSCAQVVDDGS
jgi:hypothetical protein